jgi:hypothetical protein
MIGLSLILALQAASPAAQAPGHPVPIAAPSAPALALGREIATLLNGDSTTQVQVDKIMKAMPQALLADRDTAALEAQYPGLVANMVEAARAPFLQTLKRQMPALIERLGVVYASALDENEMRQALIFYRSPTGLWLIDTVAHGADFSAMMAKMVENPDASLRGADFKGAIQGAAPSLSAEMTHQRATEILAFLHSPAGEKIKALQPRLLEVGATWTNEADPVGDKAVEDAMVNAIKDFIAKHDAAPQRPKASSRRASTP